MSEEIIEREFKDLSPEDRKEVVRLFNLAAFRRAQQWDAEAAIEALLGRDIEIDVPAYACAMDHTHGDPYQIFEEDEVAEALEEDR
jgi:hypothetical protein